MKHQPTARRVTALALAAAFVGSPVGVGASGFQLVEQNGSGLGNAYAGQAAAGEDASAVYFNPAALTRVPGKQLALAVSEIGISTTFTDSASSRPSLGPLSLPVTFGGAGGDAGAWKAVPNAYVSWQAASKLWLGLGVNAPFGLKTEWDPTWVGRFHAIKSDVTTVNINPTVAVRVNDVLSLGAGASYQRLDAELTQAVAYGGIAVGTVSTRVPPALMPAALAGIVAQLGPSGLAREGVATIKGDDWAWGWNVGATLKLGEPGRLAVAYRSRVKHSLEGQATFADAPQFITTGPLGALGQGLNAAFASGPVTADIELPDTLSVAAAYEGDKLTLLADWTRTGWSTIESLPIERASGSMVSDAPLAFEDIWRVGFGATYMPRNNWKLRFGTAFDKAPVQDQYRTPRLPDQDRIWAAAGLQYKVGRKGAIDLGYAHLFLKDASSNLPNQDTPTSAPAGKLVGTYQAKVDILSLQYRLSF